MKKKIAIFIITLFVTILNVSAYEIYIPKGSLIKVYTVKPLTTETLEEGSTVHFTAYSDVWVLEKKVIEKGDIFKGYVNNLKMPVQGVNAALSIKITELINKNGEKNTIDGRIIFNNSDTLGGNLTNPASYNKTIHPRRVYGNYWGGTLQYVPSGEYEFGKHLKIDAKDNIFVQFDENYYI